MKKALASAVLGLAAVLTTPMAQAALSVADLATAGDGLLTVDSDSGLAWLDVSLTRGMSLDEVANGAWIGQGFRLATSADLQTLLSHDVGYQYGFMEAMGAWSAPATWSTYLGGPTTLLTGVLGGEGARTDGQVPAVMLMLTRDTRIDGELVPRPDDLPMPDGWSDITASPVILLEDLQAAREAAWTDLPGDPPLVYAELSELVDPSQQNGTLGNFLRKHTFAVNPQALNPDVGVFLVKDVSVVPEPSAFVLMGLGLVGVFALRVRSRS